MGSRSKLSDIWTFTKSTFEKSQDFSSDRMSDTDIREFGLPLARIYARYFGGDLKLLSMEGVGLDAYLYLPVLGSACENLPKSVAISPGNLDSSIQTSHCASDRTHLDRVSEIDTHKTNLWGVNSNVLDSVCNRAL